MHNTEVISRSLPTASYKLSDATTAIRTIHEAFTWETLVPGSEEADTDILQKVTNAAQYLRCKGIVL